MSSRKRLLLGASTLAIFCSGAASAQSATQDNDDEVIEEVVVTGIRASLQRGLDTKRNASVVVDAISAEDVGKFPDQNVAESLQRITGVAITRSRGGEGQFVTVRGLGQEFNTLTYKGRELATENPGREFSFDVVPSELISAAQVFKTVAASQTDGSIGGLVNIETASALARPGFHITASAGTQLESLNDEFGFKGALILSDTFADDTFGIIGSIAFQERDFRTDTAESINIDSSTDFNGDGVNDRLNSFNGNVNFEERERLGATLALEWQPSDDTKVVIDGLYTSFESPSNSDSFSVFTQPPNVTDAVVDEFNNVVSQNTNFGANGTSNNFGVAFTNIFDVIARQAQTDTETYQVGLNYEQRFTDNFTVKFDASYSNADGVRDNIFTGNGSGSFFVVGFPGLNFSQTANGGPVPDAVFGILPSFNTGPFGGANPVTSLDPSVNVDPLLVGIDELSAENSRLHFSRNSSNFVEDEIFTVRGDATWDVGEDATLKFGFDYIDREKSNQLFDNANGFCGDATIAIPSLTDPAGNEQTAFVCDRSIGFADLLPADQLANLLTLFDGESEGFLSSTDANIPRNFLTVNQEVVEAAFLALGQLPGVRRDADGNITESGTVASLSGVASFLNPALNQVQSNTIEEEIFSSYVQADFQGEFASIPFRANAGVRVAITDVTSTGASSNLTFITIDPLATGGSGNNPITVDNTGVLEVQNQYVDVLPSFNISFDLRDDLIFRTGFSQSLARPTFNDLSTVFAVTQINEGTEATSGGNPNLEAVRSNNLDFSVEYYGENGLTLTLAGFYKDINNFIANGNSDLTITIPDSLNVQTGQSDGPVTVTFENSGPLNGDDAEIFGLELGAQYLHSSGFGVAGNLTLADSNATFGGNPGQFENISDFSANASVFYENHGLQARVSLNHRGEFLSSTEGEGGFAEFTADFTQVDLSVSYSLEELTGHNVSLFVEGINVFNEQFFNFSEQPAVLESFIDNGARWLFGARYSF